VNAGPDSGNETQSSESGAKGWWKVGFHRPYEQEQEPAWYLDSLIAYKIIKPVLDGHPDIALWRFHRRASHDAAGHEFSFLFYAPRNMAVGIYAQIKEFSLTKSLLNDHYIDHLSSYDINGNLRSKIAATSDTHWPAELQNTWPYFIMGASQTWLGLIGEFYLQQPEVDEQDIGRLVDSFKQVNEDINKLWEVNGGHAFLHHLNALFGYQELYITERRPMRF